MTAPSSDGPAAARLGDPIEHESLLSEIGQMGAGLLTGIAVGALFGLAAAAVIGTGGLGAVVLAGVMAFGADKVMHAAGLEGPGDLPGDVSKVVGGALDSVFPPEVMGHIGQSSPDVIINDLAAARAVPGPGDDNLVICDRHTPKQHVAEGSSTVFINGAPAHRVGDQTDCGGKTSKGSPNVFIGGPPIATREIASGMPGWLDKAGFFLGIALALCTRDWKSIPGKLGCVLLEMGVAYATDKALTTAFGKPVHAPTGAKILDGTEDFDFALPALLPLRWVRTYNSLDTAEGPLGPGWRLPVTVTLSATSTGGGSLRATLTDAQGIDIPFDPLVPGTAMANIFHGWTLGRVEGRWVARDPDGLCYDFGPDQAGRDLPLQRIEDRNGNAIMLAYDGDGRLAALTDGAGRRYVLGYDATHARRIASVAWIKRAAEPETETPEATVVLVRYGYDAAGRLATVTDRAGAVVRRFGWHDVGPGRGLMAMQTLPTGLVSHYEWVEGPDHPRVARHWTSAGAAWQAEYRTGPDGKSGTTQVTDHLGRVQAWDWIGPYQIVAYTDPLGRTWRWQHDADLLPVACIEPDGATWTQRYDGQGRLVEATDPLGGIYRAEWWHVDPMLPVLEAGPDGAETRYEYDARGNLAEIEHPGGRVALTRDARGAVIEQRDERGGVNRWQRLPDGQPARFTDCSGKVTRWDYDGEGKPIRETDAEGGFTVTTWDEAGRLAMRRTPDTIVQTWRWLPGGYLGVSERSGAATHYSWDAAGRLAGTVDPAGARVERRYDSAGRLAALVDGNGQETQFEYDAGDRLVAETGIDGLRTEYALDDRDLPVTVVRGAGTAAATRLALERDALGRLVAKHSAEAVTRYAYDPVGRVTAVKRFARDGETPVDRIGFGYDAAGRLVEETTEVRRLGHQAPDGWTWTALPAPRHTTIRHRHDALGNITATSLPHGPDLRYLRYGSGHLLQINLGDTVVSELVRDDLHRETLRSQGALESRFALDPVGRRLSVATAAAAPVGFGAGSGELFKEYDYNDLGLLARRRERGAPERRYGYDRAGRIATNEALPARATPGSADPPSDPLNESFAWDKASNAMPVDRALRVIAGAVEQNRVVQWGGTRYDYDAQGRMVRKSTPSGPVVFAWNDEHQLVASGSVRGEWRYHYDALGRRIAKQRHDGARADAATWFVWDGLRLAQEVAGEHCVTTIYEDAGSYVPLARVEQGIWEKTVRPDRIFHFHTDVNGAPEELTGHDGKRVWRARYKTWGNLATEAWDRDEEWAEGARRRSQNLRFQGQYFDAETGLHYNTFRYYDPEIGRFASQDPIGLRGGINLYQYAPNPISWIDPWGLASDLSGSDASGRPLSSPNYSNWTSVQMPADVQAGDRPAHFKYANEQLNNNIQQNPELGRALGPDVVNHVSPGPRGGFSDRSPPELTWHHNAQNPSQLDLVPRAQHRAPGPVQESLHPGGEGGFKKLRPCR